MSGEGAAPHTRESPQLYISTYSCYLLVVSSSQYLPAHFSKTLAVHGTVCGAAPSLSLVLHGLAALVSLTHSVSDGTGWLSENVIQLTLGKG